MFRLPKIRNRQHSRGQALVEFALIVPVMLLLLLIAIDFGRLFFSYVAINNAAREGASFASVVPTACGGNPCLSTSGIATHASQETNSQNRGGGAIGIDVTATCAKPGGTTILCSAATVGGLGTGNTVTVGLGQDPPANIGGCSNSKPFLQTEIGPPYQQLWLLHGREAARERRQDRKPSRQQGER
jgi:uncharacterized membrane protein